MSHKHRVYYNTFDPKYYEIIIYCKDPTTCIQTLVGSDSGGRLTISGTCKECSEEILNDKNKSIVETLHKIGGCTSTVAFIKLLGIEFNRTDWTKLK